MKLKETIQNDLIASIKSKNETAKLALQALKTKIVEAEKNNMNNELDDSEVIKIINKLIKQREDSIAQYKTANRFDLIEKEELEIITLSTYMPKKLTRDEIVVICSDILSNLKQMNLNRIALMGKTIGEFNKKYSGMANIDDLKLIINDLI